MKKISVIVTLLWAGNILASQELCDVEVQNSNIIIPEDNRYSVNFVRALFNFDHATTKECFNEKGAIILGTYPNGEVRAVIF